MRRRVNKPLPKAATPEARVQEVTDPYDEGCDKYRGRPDVRWRFNRHAFQVAARCRCGRWWGWAEEGREGELLELLGEGCPKCSIE